MPIGYSTDAEGNPIQVEVDEEGNPIQNTPNTPAAVSPVEGLKNKPINDLTTDEAQQLSSYYGEQGDWTPAYYWRHVKESKINKKNPVSFDEFQSKIDTSDYEGSYKNIVQKEQTDVDVEKATEATTGRVEKQEKTEADKIAENKKTTVANIENLSKKIQEARSKLYGETEAAGQQLISKIGGQRTQRLGELSGLLSKQREEAFNINAPDILEQLSGRGLLRSSETGAALGREKSRLQTYSENALRQQALADLDIQQNIEKEFSDRLLGIKEAGLGFETQMGTYGVGEASRLGDLDLASLQELGRYGMKAADELSTAGLQRKYSLDDILRNEGLAKQIEESRAKSAETSALYGMGGQIIGGLAGGGLTSILPSLPKTKGQKIPALDLDYNPYD